MTDVKGSSGKNPHSTPNPCTLGAFAVGPHHKVEIGRKAAGKKICNSITDRDKGFNCGVHSIVRSLVLVDGGFVRH